MKKHPVLSTLTRNTLALLAALALQADPTPPDKMTYQGYLVDANGVMLAPNNPANYPVVFRIYDASQGGTLLWSEQQIVTVDKGNFSVVLGEGTQYQSEVRDPLSSVFSATGASDRYIGISVTIGANTTEIAPRLRLLPAPYAFLAKSANALVGTDGSPLLTTATGGVLNAGGDLNADGNVSAGGDVNASGNVTAAGLNVTGTATATTFVGNGTIPIGGIILWSGAVADIPAGWALCDGGVHDGRATPNLRDRFVIGAGWSYGVNATGGTTTKTLAVANLPSHSHSYSDDYFEAVASVGWGTIPLSNVGNNRTRSSTTGATGSNSPFDIMPPYYALAYIMRTR